jgi:hypothetical protein
MNDITTRIDRKKVLLILEWCKKKFGKSKYWEYYPFLRVYKTKGIYCDNDGDGRYGQCLEGTITVFLGRHKTVLEVCNTVIHEYKHYLLSDDNFYLKLKELKKRGVKENDAIRNHPDEKITKKFADKWAHVCYNELKRELYKK